MAVTTIRCQSCGYEWRPRGKSRRCPSCLRILGETKVREWERAEIKLEKLLSSRGWNVKPVGGRKAIDVCAERKGKKLLIDVKAGNNYLIRRSQLKNLLAYWDKRTDVGFACQMDEKFYLLMLKGILPKSSSGESMR